MQIEAEVTVPYETLITSYDTNEEIQFFPWLTMWVTQQK